MSEYISKESLVKTVLDTPFTMSMCLSVQECQAMNRAREIIADAIKECPAADVRPVKPGRWIPVTNGRGGHECSLCREYAPSFQNGDEYKSAYCPNCGAEMKWEQT